MGNASRKRQENAVIKSSKKWRMHSSRIVVQNHWTNCWHHIYHCHDYYRGQIHEQLPSTRKCSHLPICLWFCQHYSPTCIILSSSSLEEREILQQICCCLRIWRHGRIQYRM